MPKFAMLVRATATAESGTFPPTTAADLQAMQVYNTSLVDAGVLLSADGFLPSSRGARVHFSSSPDAEPAVTHGPFDVSSLVSGYWIIKAASLEEAVSWAKKVPFKTDDATVEVRQIATAEDFGEHASEELKEKGEALRERIGQAKAE